MDAKNGALGGKFLDISETELKPFREFFIRNGGLFCITGDPERVKVTTYFFFGGIWLPDIFDWDWASDGRRIEMAQAFVIALYHLN